MIVRYPTYYKQFHCIASKCKNSCCSAGWEIDIDDDTANYYNSIPGDFGNILRQNINYKSTPKCFILHKNGRCPFLNDNNLCDIYSTLGEESLCEICKEHPRFYEFFFDITECGIGLYCEEATRIILSQTKKFSTYQEDVASTSNEPNYDFRDTSAINLYKYLYNVRSKMFKYIENNNIPLNSRIKDILWYAYIIQQNIDNELYDDDEIFSIVCKKNLDIEPIIDYLANLEPNDPNWPSYLKQNYKKYNKNISKIKEFENTNPQILHYLKNISTYFIYRYLLKASFDGDILSKIKLMVISVITLKFLYFCKWLDSDTLTFEDCITITRKFSEEIECSDDSLSDLATSSYSLAFFSTENLINLL